MTDTKKLEEVIERSGLKKKYIADCLHIHPASFSRKVNNESDFTAMQIDILCAVLGIDDLQLKDEIFFANKVDY